MGAVGKKKKESEVQEHNESDESVKPIHNGLQVGSEHAGLIASKKNSISKEKKQ